MAKHATITTVAIMAHTSARGPLDGSTVWPCLMLMSTSCEELHGGGSEGGAEGGGKGGGGEGGGAYCGGRTTSVSRA